MTDSGNADPDPKVDSSGRGRAGVMPRNGPVIASPINIMETEDESYCYEETYAAGKGDGSVSGGNDTGTLEQRYVIIRDGRYH